jgi:hypothetical protein
MSGCPEAAQGPERIVSCHYNGNFFLQPPASARASACLARKAVSEAADPETLRAGALDWSRHSTEDGNAKLRGEYYCVFKAKKTVIEMDFDNTCFEAETDVSTWDAIAEWEPILRYIAVVTDYLQSDTNPFSGAHASFSPRNCRGVVFGPRVGSVDDYIVAEEALRKHILARLCACILSGPPRSRLPRCISGFIHQAFHQN